VVDIANGYTSISATEINDVRHYHNNIPAALLTNADTIHIDGPSAVEIDLDADASVEMSTNAANGLALIAQGGAVPGELAQLWGHALMNVVVDGAVARNGLLQPSETNEGEFTAGNNNALLMALAALGATGTVQALALNRPTPPYFAIEHNEGGTYSTTSATFGDVDATDLTGTIYTRGGPVLIIMLGTKYGVSSVRDDPVFDFYIDGARHYNAFNYGAGGSKNYYADVSADFAAALAIALATDLAAGQHDIKLQFRVSEAGTGILLSNNDYPVIFFAVEL